MPRPAAWLLVVLAGTLAVLGLRACAGSTEDGAVLPADERSAESPTPTAASPAPVAAPPAADDATYRAALQALHRYVGALPGAERASADAMWSGGAPAADSREADLRSLDTYPAWMRLASRSTDMVASGDGVRLPVELRLGYADGVRVYRGWYALRPGDSGWEITGAAIDAATDGQ